MCFFVATLKTMQKQLLIFDLDGTLIDSRLDLATGINLMRRHYNLPPLPADTIAGWIGEGIHNLVKRCLQGHPADLEEAVRINYASYLKHIHEKTSLYPGVADGLAALYTHGHELALFSNKRAGASRMILEHFKLMKFFKNIIGGDSNFPLKPAPEGVCELMRRAGAGAENTWIIGDNHTDLAAARNAKVKSVFVNYGIGEAQGEKASLYFDDFTSLAGYFLN